MHRVLTEYFRCPDIPTEFSVAGCLSQKPGYFSFGPEIVCYGRASRTVALNPSNGHCHDVSGDAQLNGSVIQLPFDPAEVIDNLRYERYVSRFGNGYKRGIKTAVYDAYYLVRPALPVGVRKHLQRVRLGGWRRLPFPKWPVDTTVDTLMEKLLALVVRSVPMKAVPFIWFWPDGAAGSVIMTHDVETEKGIQLSTYMMDINDSCKIPASFQIVPESRYNVTEKYLSTLRDRGFEVSIQDLNHDGHLFRNWEEFKRRVVKINRYGREFRSIGFRSAVLYRNQEWYDLLQFEYDMSVPNVAHLDPQRGGCCTVMPYFAGKILELPVTTTQDYSLFHIVNDYSLSLWRQQIDTILKRNGLIHFIIHPDYIVDQRTQNVYRALLRLLTNLRRDENVWIALPQDVNQWWRQRSQMQIVKRCGRWKIEGPGSERARLALATCEDDRVVYRLCGEIAV